MKSLFFANTDWYLYNFRIPLIQAMQDNVGEVVLVSPSGEYGSRLLDHGYKWLSFPLTRSGINPFRELWALLRLKRVYQQENADIYVHFTIKCVLYGSLAAKWLGKKTIINSIDGLGYVFSDSSLKARLLQKLIKPIYRFALQKTHVIFQNPEDRDLFLKKNFLKEGQYSLIRGVGIDLNRHTVSEEPEGKPVVVLAGRLLYSKGVAVMVQAARRLLDEGVDARFVLVGDSDPGNPESIEREVLIKWQSEGVVELWGWRDDMHQVYRQMHIVCLPTLYREGLPLSLMEACASGIPVVASDTPGCREIVKDGVNGFLVPPGDVDALAAALKKLIETPELRKKMGKSGREIVEENFSSKDIVRELLEIIEMQVKLSQ